MKVTDGFVKADSRNLPKVDEFMLLQFMRENDCFNVAAIRGAKVLMSSRQEYVETCVGYVEVRRENSLCYVQCKVMPEHRVRTKMYTVLATINEEQDVIENAKCADCTASEGGCKHAICCIMWLKKRTEEPSVTSVACYWAQPKLSVAMTKEKIILAEDIGKKVKRSAVITPSLDSFLDECKKRKISNSLLLNYNQPKQTLDQYSVFDILLKYKSNNCTNDVDWDNFKCFANSLLSDNIKSAIESETRQQANSVLWHTLRQGRITASRIYEATRCSVDGVLVQTILGGYKVPDTKAIRRGKRLEKQVIKQIGDNLKVKIRECGFKLISPFIGATPDGVCADFCVEVKCPMSKKTFENYIKDNTIQPKFKAQVQIQMHATGKSKALFCVADPSYETTKLIKHYWLSYDQSYVKDMLTGAEDFWRKFILQKMCDSTTLLQY